MGYRSKRFLDVAISLLLLVFLSPLFLLISLAIRFFSGAPVIYRREVIGLEGKPFNMFKFRTMIDYADKQEQELFKQTNYRKPINDPRVTRIGEVLRKTSFNELPQLINVIMGDMSLVGWRPLPSWMVGKLSEPIKKTYFSLQPGITGLAQITDRCLSPFSVAYDRLITEYFENCSLLFDLKILLKTIPVVFSGRGA